jgi:hypothetical protein
MIPGSTLEPTGMGGVFAELVKRQTFDDGEVD